MCVCESNVIIDNEMTMCCYDIEKLLMKVL
jgi:hypothetical protein